MGPLGLYAADRASEEEKVPLSGERGPPASDQMVHISSLANPVRWSLLTNQQKDADLRPLLLGSEGHSLTSVELLPKNTQPEFNLEPLFP